MIKSKLIIIVFVLLLKFSFGQIWCNTGATWHFSYNGPFATGYVQHTYVKDTLILGKLCNRIVAYKQGVGTTGPYSGYNPTIHTYSNNTVVFIKDLLSNSFDTLFDIGANIGDSWHLPPSSISTCNNSRLYVIDTGHVVIQTQNLKWLSVGWSPFSTPWDTIIERIGPINKYMYYFGDVCPTGPDQEIGGALRCYSDNQISNYKHKYTNNCNYFYSVGVKELYPNYDFEIYPNPVKDKISFSLFSFQEADLIILYNCFGERVRAINPKNIEYIDVSDLADGFYYMEFIIESNIISVRKFIKSQ